MTKNEDVKAEEVPRLEERSVEKPAERKGCALDGEARQEFLWIPEPVNADARHKADLEQFAVTDASVRDSQKFDDHLNKTNTSADVYADSAYRSAETEAKLKVPGLHRRIRWRASRNHPLSKPQENATRKKSKIRARVEHVFGAPNRPLRGWLDHTDELALLGRKLQNRPPEPRGLQHSPPCLTLERTAAVSGNRLPGTLNAIRTEAKLFRTQMSHYHWQGGTGSMASEKMVSWRGKHSEARREM